MENIYLDDLGKISIKQFEAAIQGMLCVYVGGEVKEMQLSSKECAAFDKAKLIHYIVKEPNQERLDNLYYDYCKIVKTYWICIKLHGDPHDSCNFGEDHAVFWYDLFGLRHGLTPQAFRELNRLFERARPGAYEFSHNKIEIVGGHVTVPEYTAEKLARALVELFNDPTTLSAEMFNKAYPHGMKE